MRTRLWLPAVLMVAAAVFPASMLAQFQPPTQEELKMTSEPKAPGAAAIYLYREETVDDNLHYHGSYERIKVLTEKGKELATVHVPYPAGMFKVTDIKARTIHPDGTVIPLDVKPEDLLIYGNAKAGTRIKQMVFTLPSVEIGSILEYRWQIRYDDETLSTPDWDIQQQYYVRKAHYSFVPFKFLDRVVDSRGNGAGKLLEVYALPKGQKLEQDPSGRFTVDVTDIPPIPDEDYMPPLYAFLFHVEFYYAEASSKDDYWKLEGNRWSKEMDHFASESKTIKNTANELTSPSDSEEVKAHKLYAAVMKLDNTDFTRTRSEAERKELKLKPVKQAEDVLNQKSGTGDEIALLYLALARSAGLKAYALALSDRSKRVFNPYFLNTRQLDDVLAVVTVGGKEILVDPGQKGAPFGQLSWKHTNAAGLRQTDHGPTFTQTSVNPYKEAATSRTADVTIDRTGAVTGSVRIGMNGPEALSWRQKAVENDQAEVKKQFEEYINRQLPDGVHADFDHFLGLEDLDSVLMAVVKISGNLGTATGKRVFLPGAFFASRSRERFVTEEKRETPVDMHYAEVVSDQVIYRLPDTFTVESAPAAQSIPWTGHAAFQVKTATDKNTLQMGRSLARAFAVLDPKEYGDLRDFYRKVETADQQQVVLTVAKGSSGN